MAQMGFAPLIERHHGIPGGQALRALMSTLRQLYTRYQPVARAPRIVLFQFLPTASYPTSGIPSPLHQMADVLHWISQPMTIEVTSDGTLRVWPSLNMVDLGDLSQHAVVYSFEHGQESFWAGGEQSPIPQVFPGAVSLFAIPTFRILQDALNHYRSPVVRACQCEILQSAWYDTNRLFFKAKPEKLIRRSLVQFLRACLRNDAEVAPEQNLDESHPIDIRVTFEFTSSVALIEIKWLGQSRREEDGMRATAYTEVRAREGAQQLANYLDMFHSSAPQRHARGYLVIIDGRRRGLTSQSTSITDVDGLYYDHREISFAPAFHNLRQDFEEPSRMFAEPICH